MKRDIAKRLDALEAQNDNGRKIMIFKWTSWTNEQALAKYDAERAIEGNPPRDPSTPLLFVAWRDDHLDEPVPCKIPLFPHDPSAGRKKPPSV